MAEADDAGLAETGFRLRPAAEDDFAAIAEIYGHFVLYGLASFEEAPPEAAELQRRWRALVEQGYPYIVAEAAAPEGRILGYAYAGPYRPRPAYRYTVEDSVYVAQEAARRGVGGALLDAIIAACTELGYRQMIGIVGDSANNASIGLHRSRGFRDVGTFEAVGFKHGRWVDSVLLQRPLGDGAASLPHSR